MSNFFFQGVQERVPPEYFFFAAVACSLLLVLEAPAPSVPATGMAVALEATEAENPFDSLELSARAAYVLDVKAERRLFAKNEREPLPLASITKVMTAATALSSVPETTYIAIGERAIQEEGDSGFRAGERWLLRDLLAFTLLESSNDGAVAVSSSVGSALATTTKDEEGGRKLFIGKMNERAKELGLTSAHFLNETGLDISKTEVGAVASAADTARLFAFALKTFPQVFAETRWSELSLENEGGERHDAVNTNTDTKALPLLLASKTGYTDLAGGTLVIAFDAGFNRPIIIAVLGSTAEERFTDVEKLVWATLEALQSN